jgi:hypothetical protein
MPRDNKRYERGTPLKQKPAQGREKKRGAGNIQKGAGRFHGEKRISGCPASVCRLVVTFSVPEIYRNVENDGLITNGTNALIKVRAFPWVF